SSHRHTTWDNVARSLWGHKTPLTKNHHLLYRTTRPHAMGSHGSIARSEIWTKSRLQSLCQRPGRGISACAEMHLMTLPHGGNCRLLKSDVCCGSPCRRLNGCLNAP